MSNDDPTPAPSNQYLARKAKLEKDRCDRCAGLGQLDDAEPGDAYFNQWRCPECKGTGLKSSAVETSGALAQMSPAAADVIAERLRQLAKEGWTTEHDDQHSDGQLAEAAACYALSGAGNLRSTFERWWPWSFAWWKPKGERRDLVRAGALILAEIERLDRASKKASARPAHRYDGQERCVVCNAPENNTLGCGGPDCRCFRGDGNERCPIHS